MDNKDIRKEISNKINVFFNDKFDKKISYVDIPVLNDNIIPDEKFIRFYRKNFIILDRLFKDLLSAIPTKYQKYILESKFHSFCYTIYKNTNV
jgi:hypothetical protein